MNIADMKTFPAMPNPHKVKASRVYDSARIPHCWYNESDALLRILVVKVPRPTEQTRLL